MISLAIWFVLAATLVPDVLSFAPSPPLYTRRTALSAAQTFQFQGHDIYAEVNTSRNNNGNKKPAVILIHGFGCSTIYWRETTKALVNAGYTVHALDLLGQGKSAKPGRADGIEYSINLWAQLVDEYAAKNVAEKNVVLMGNSLGSLVALAAATGDFGAGAASLPQSVKGICMFNCGIGLNSRNVIRDPQFNAIQRAIFTALFDFLDLLIFGNIPLLTYVLDKVVTQELLKNTLTGLYQFAETDRVDDELVDSFYYPAKEPGSVEALSQIYTNDPGATPMEIYGKHKDLLEKQVPIHLVWGDQDGVTPLAGPVGQFFQNLANDDETNVSMQVVTSGHIPFDEVPEVSNGSMLRWLANVATEGAAGGDNSSPFGGFDFSFLKS